MKGTSLALLSLLAASPLCLIGEQLIPAGSLVQCTVSEPKLSSKTTAIGDPVLCQLGHSERYGRSVLPVNSYLVGRFEDYKDPGHFVGKGWMELRFDRMVIEPNTVIPVDARVVAVPVTTSTATDASSARATPFATPCSGPYRSSGPSICLCCPCAVRVPPSRKKRA